jgi:hypothetical protein
MAARRRAVADGMRRSAFGAWMLDLLVALRPVWWVLRGFGLYAVVNALLGSMSLGVGWPVLVAITLVSIQWGRDRWLPKNALRHMRTVASVAAVIALPFALGSVLSPQVEYVEGGYYEQPGLVLDGTQVGNIFAYDEDGEPIERVQLSVRRGCRGERHRVRMEGRRSRRALHRLSRTEHLEHVPARRGRDRRDDGCGVEVPRLAGRSAVPARARPRHSGPIPVVLAITHAHGCRRTDAGTLSAVRRGLLRETRAASTRFMQQTPSREQTRSRGAI